MCVKTCESTGKNLLRALAAAADEQIKIQRMKYLAKKDEILETIRQQASVDLKKEQTEETENFSKCNNQ